MKPISSTESSRSWTFDLDIAVAAEQVDEAEALLEAHFRAERFPDSINIEEAGSDLRLQIQTDERYFDSIGKSHLLEVPGKVMPVADIANVLQGKVWAASDPSRRTSKRLKDLAYIARILEFRPDLTDAVPAQLRDRLI